MFQRTAQLGLPQPLDTAVLPDAAQVALAALLQDEAKHVWYRNVRIKELR